MIEINKPEGPECPTCHYPLWETPCRNCAREERIRIASHRRMETALGGRRASQEFTPDMFQASPRLQPAKDAAVNFNPATDNLYFWGPAGTGKSHLAVVAARAHYRPDSTNVRVLKPFEIAREVRIAQEAGATEEARVIRAFIDLPILVVQDLGSAKDTEFSTSLMFEIVDGRYMDWPGGLVVTSNLRLDALASRLGNDRIPSRLAQMAKVFSFDGEPDHRLRR